MKPSFLLATCPYCDELHPSALMRRGDGFVCGSCDALVSGRTVSVCGMCGKNAPCEWHHVAGRRNSPVMIEACVNCHRVIHGGRELASARAPRATGAPGSPS